MVHCFSEMQRRDRLATRRAAAEAATPTPTPTNREEEEHVNESINVPELGSEPRPESSRQVGPTGVQVDMEQMAQMLAAAFQQPRESGASIECARKLGARSYDGTGEPKRAYRLVQGDLSVSEYEKRFSELSRLVPSVFDDEEQKTNKFRSGLNLNIRPYVTSSSLTRYGEMVDTTIRVEQSMEPTPQPQKSGQKSSWTGNSSKQGGPSKAAKSGQKSSWS